MKTSPEVIVTREETEPEDFADALKRTGTNFAAVLSPGIRQQKSSFKVIASKRPQKDPSHLNNKDKSLSRELSEIESPYQITSNKFLGQNPGSKAKIALQHLSIDHGTPHDGILTKSVMQTNKSHGRCLTDTSKTKKAYKLFSQQEGAFAFKSEAHLMQPYYPLKFAEHDLAYQIDCEELAKKKSGKKGEAMVLAMRHKLRKSLSMVSLPQSTINNLIPKTVTNTPSNNPMKQLVNSTTADAKKGAGANEAPIKIYPLSKISYNGDNKFPFQVLCDVSRTIQKSLDAIKTNKIPVCGVDIVQSNKGERLSTTGTTAQQRMSNLPDSLKNKNNELIRFLECNESGFNNLVVYMFWIIFSQWLNDNEQFQFTPQFIKEVREALCEQYRDIYFKYLIRLRHQVMDTIIDILPCFLAEIIRTLFQTKVRNHELPLQLNKTFILLIQSIFRELYGYDTSELSLQQQNKQYIKSFADRIKENVKRTQQNVSNKRTKSKAELLSPDKATSSGQNLPIGSHSVKNQNSNGPSIFSSTFKTPRDPEHNARDYSTEIKTDMVNQMIQEWGKLCSNEAKMAISDQIRAMNTVPNPEQLCNAELKSSTMPKAIHHKKHLNQFNQAGSQQNLNNFAKFPSAQNKRLTLKVEKRKSGSLHKKLHSQTVDHHQQKPSMTSLGTHLLQDEIQEGSNYQHHRKISGRSRKNSDTASQSRQEQLSQKHQNDRSKASTSHKATEQDLPKNHFKKQKIKLKEYEPQPKDQSLELLKNRIALSKKEQKYEESLSQQQYFKPEDARPQTQSLSGPKMREFDLQHVSPIIRSKFPANLQMNFNPNRKQKLMKQSREPDLERVETYKVLQYQLKKDKQVRQKEDEENARQMQLAKERRNQMRAFAQSQTVVTTSTQNKSECKRENSQSHLNHNKQSGKKTVPEKGVIKTPSIRLINLTGASNNVSGLPTITNSENETALHTGEQTRENQNSRNVRFFNIDDEEVQQMSNKIKIDVCSPESTRSNQKAAIAMRDLAKSSTPLDMQSSQNNSKQAFEGFSLSTGNGTATSQSKHTMINLRILQNEDDLMSMSSQMEKRITPAQRQIMKEARNGSFQEKNLYDHKLMQTVKKSIKRRKIEVDTRNGSADSARSSQLPQVREQATDTLKTSVASLEGKAGSRQLMGRSKSISALKANQQLPLLSTNTLSTEKPEKAENNRTKQGGILVAGIRPKERNTVSFNEEPKGDEDFKVQLPFTEKDTQTSLMRKTTKIIAKGKYKLVTDGTKYQPMHKQLVDYIANYNDKEEETEKMIVQEYIRKRLKNMLPQDIRKKESEKAFSMPPPPDYLASKHTYASMRKMAGKKSRKQFIFDDYELEQKRREALFSPPQQKASLNQTKGSQSAQNLKALLSKQQPVVEKPQSVGQLTEKTVNNTLTHSNSQSQNTQYEQDGLKTYHIHKGSHFQRGNKALNEASRTDYNTNNSGLPPKPSGHHAKTSINLHAIPGFNKIGSAFNQNNNTTSRQTILGQMTESLRNKSSHKDKIQKESIQSLDSAVFTSDDSMDSTGRREQDEWLRKNHLLNENDDKADQRDGVTQTKGKVHLTSGEDITRLKMGPREQNTKIYCMLQEMRGHLERDNERREAVRQQNRQEMEVVDSDEELERLADDQDYYVARPNPLEPQPMMRKKSKQVQSAPGIRESDLGSARKLQQTESQQVTNQDSPSPKQKRHDPSSLEIVFPIPAHAQKDFVKKQVNHRIKVPYPKQSQKPNNPLAQNEIYRKQVAKIRNSMQEVDLFDKKTFRKAQYLD